jgi:hypothetical protein
MAVVRALVHLGPMKTGTSAFAAHLSRRATAGTLPQHIVYPTGDLWFPARGGIVKHHDLVEIAPARANVAGEDRRKTDVTPDMLTDRLATIARQARERMEDTLVVFVCEIADQRATPELGRELARYFDTVNFVIVARDQVSAIRSLLGQQIRMWNRTDVVSLESEDFVRSNFRRGSYDYARLWQKWSTPKSDYRVHFVPYRDGSGTDDLSQEIFSAVGLGQFPHSPDLLDGGRIHSTFSANRMRDLARIKRWANRLSAIPAAQSFGKWLFDVTLRRAHAQVTRNRGGRFATWKLLPSEQADIRAAYRESNEEFQRQLGKAAVEPRWKSWFDVTLGTSA